MHLNLCFLLTDISMLSKRPDDLQAVEMELRARSFKIMSDNYVFNFLVINGLSKQQILFFYLAKQFQN